MDFVDAINQLVSTVGMWGVFALLYYQEKKAHQHTREMWVDDLRDIAGMKQRLGNNPPALQGKQSPDDR